MTSKMIAADGGTLIMDSSDASIMASSFEVWPTGVLEVGSATSTGNPFPDNPTSIINDGLIRVKTTETLKNVTGLGTIEAATGTTTLQNNPTFQGGVRVKAGATAISADADGLGTGQFGDVMVEDSGQLRISTSGTLFQEFQISGDGGGAGAVQIAASADVTFADSVTVNGMSSTLDTGVGATATVKLGIRGAGSLAKQGPGTLHLKGENTYTGRTVVRDGRLIVDQSTGFGETIVDPGGVLEARAPCTAISTCWVAASCGSIPRSRRPLGYCSRTISAAPAAHSTARRPMYRSTAQPGSRPRPLRTTATV